MRRTLIALALLILSCAPPTVVPVPSQSSERPTVTPTPTATVTLPPTGPTPSPIPTVHIVPPEAAGAVPEVGTLIVRDALGALYRYDAAAGTVTRVTDLSAWTVAAETPSGAYEIGLQGGGVFVPWAGGSRPIGCDGYLLSVTPSGACVSRVFGPDGGMFAQYPGETRPRLLLPSDWGAGQAAWDPAGRRLAVTRTVETQCNRCPNALWIVEPDGRVRDLYEGCCGLGHGMVGGLRWSPLGDTIAMWLSSGCAGCDADAGLPLLVVDVASARATLLGPTPGTAATIAWSPTGALAFVRGTLNTRSDEVLMLRSADGSVRPLDPGGFAPAWDGAGERLAWARSDGTASVLDLGTGARRSITCSGGRIEGIRFSADGAGLLLLCKSPDANLDRYDVHFVTAGRDLTVVRGLGGTLAYNFDSPDLFAIVAWERGASLTR